MLESIKGSYPPKVVDRSCCLQDPLRPHYSNETIAGRKGNVGVRASAFLKLKGEEREDVSMTILPTNSRKLPQKQIFVTVGFVIQ